MTKPTWDYANGLPPPPNPRSPLDRLDDLGLRFIDGKPDGPLDSTAAPVVDDENGFSPEEALLFLAGAQGQVPSELVIAAANVEVQSGAMIALVPSSADKARIVLPDGEPMDILHVTLLFLGEAVDIPEGKQTALVEWARGFAEGLRPIQANAFAAAMFNPGTDKACWVLEVGEVDATNPVLVPVHDDVEASVGRIMTVPMNHYPWRPHITLIYEDNTDWAYEVADATGPITLNTLRVAIGGVTTDFALVTPSLPDEEALYSATTADGGVVMSYHAALRTELPESQPWAVVKDSDGSIVTCHATRTAAETQIRAITAHEARGGTVAFVAGHVTFSLLTELADEIADAPIVDLTGDDPVEEEEAVQSPGAWEGILALEGTPTGDGRQFAVAALTWAELPIPLLWQKQVIGEGHMGQVTAGSINEIWRDGSMIRGRGNFDLNGVDGAEAYRQVREGFLKGLSIDPDSISDPDIELIFPEGDGTAGVEDMLFGPAPELTIFHAGRIRATTLVQIPAFVEAQLWLTDGMQVTQSLAASGGVDQTHYSSFVDGAWDTDANRARLARLMDPVVAAGAFAYVPQQPHALGETRVARGTGLFLHHEVGVDGKPGAANITACASAIAAVNANTQLDHIARVAAYEHLARHIRSAGLVPIPFIAGSTLVAASHTIVINDLPPSEWFDEPTDVPVYGALTVTDEGRVYGYLAPDKVAHRSFRDRTIHVPRNVDYSRFMGRETIVAGGERITTGCITMNCGHASTNPRVSGDDAMEHYDNSCAIVASICVGENKHGTWVAGALLPDIDADSVTRMMACQLSGDWRPLPAPVNGRVRELAAALLVPVPGFPMARTRSSVRVDAVGQLVASAVPVRFIHGTEQVDNPLHSVAQRVARGIGRDTASRVAALKDRIHNGR